MEFSLNYAALPTTPLQNPFTKLNGNMRIEEIRLQLHVYQSRQLLESTALELSR